MRVLITGGTGFVGSHTAAAVARAGHTVRLLVRRPERVGAALAPFGMPPVDIVTGDLLDPESAQAAVADCDAIINAAGIYSLDPRKAASVLATNARATEIVLEAAVQAGLDPIIHVSSYVALLPSRSTLTTDSPVGAGGPAYPRSKAQSELVARRHQEAGVPVVTTYPGAAAGPHDPYFGDTAFTLAMILRNRAPFAVRGMWAVADVGYIARAHAAMLEQGRGPRRYLLTGHDITWNDLYSSLRHLTGRGLPAVPTPGFLARTSGHGMDVLQRTARTRLPIGYQGPWIITRYAGADDTLTRHELRIEPPPLQQTLADTIRWMVEARYLPARLARDLLGKQL
ncbi:MAG TPA: SDR family NAD(P)-dependent oxidoreductase [Streptosporangiaceae bacterium]|nr:SDR family NAD(P)-dependent oxidoreductase [Streptosporangiaceae bacterium]